jgi:hypothetical protein
MVRTAVAGAVLIVLATASGWADHIKPASLLTHHDRAGVLARSQVWTPIDVAHVDIRRGPPDPHGFAQNQTITCDYTEVTFNGASDKFGCAIDADDVLKVKYGRDNGEVYAEVAGTRLLWALGFGADHMYPVRVICRGCSQDPRHDPGRHEGTVVFDPAAVERQMPGKALDTPGRIGWKWPELDRVSEAAGGAPLAQRDALKLLAVMIQHTDSKPQQQRLICQDRHPKREDAAACEHPFMLINDLGITFGRATRTNGLDTSSVNLKAWSSVDVFTDDKGRCIGNISKSITGTLDHPHISEEGRAFLANLLMQLSDAQIHDLFDVARFPIRMRPRSLTSGTVDEWVAAFKAKRQEIVTRSCTQG